MESVKEYTHLGKKGAILISTTLNPCSSATLKLVSTQVPGSPDFPIFTVPHACHILIAVLRTYSYITA